MRTTPLNSTWVYWFRTIASLNSLRQEEEAITRILSDQKDYPYLTNLETKRYKKKKLLVQAKMRIMESGAYNNGK